MKKLLYFIAFLLSVYSCKEVYNPNVSSPASGYLVVEGFINSGIGPTSITLSRTTKLEDPASIVYEQHAQVTVESESSSESYPLYEGSNGTYTSDTIMLNSNQKYRLHIRTADGKEYGSDYEPVKYTPVIDSITWQTENDGLRIYANAHDDENKIKYYQWKYNETWEFHSAYTSTIEYQYDPVTSAILGIQYRNPDHTVDTTIYKCWQSNVSSSIILGSTEKLSEDRVYLPVQYIEPGSEKLSVLYSIEVKQYALSHEAYMFNEIMKKNTEQLGSIFDPQPSELQGNIHCLTDPAEITVGYVDITQEQVKRIFIYRSQVPDWGYRSGCTQIEVDNDIDSILQYGRGLTLTNPASYQGMAIKSFYGSTVNCVDCTTRGSNVRPSFWP